MLRLEHGQFGLSRHVGARLSGTQKLTCEMTLRDGRIVYELNGLSRPSWDTLPKGYRVTGNPRWDGNRASNGGRAVRKPQLRSQKLRSSEYFRFPRRTIMSRFLIKRRTVSGHACRLARHASARFSRPVPKLEEAAKGET